MKLTRIFSLLLVIWVGSALTVGYLVAPVLFTTLDRVVAGNVAGQMFRIESLISLTCGVLCLALCNWQVRQVQLSQQPWRRMRLWVLAILTCTAIGFFVLLPWMNGLKEQAAQAGVALASSPQAHLFGILHGVSSTVYLIQSICGVMLCWQFFGFANKQVTV